MPKTEYKCKQTDSTGEQSNTISETMRMQFIWHNTSNVMVLHKAFKKVGPAPSLLFDTDSNIPQERAGIFRVYISWWINVNWHLVFLLALKIGKWFYENRNI